MAMIIMVLAINDNIVMMGYIWVAGVHFNANGNCIGEN